jgi:hypothetical protein
VGDAALRISLRHVGEAFDRALERERVQERDRPIELGLGGGAARRGEVHLAEPVDALCAGRPDPGGRHDDGEQEGHDEPCGTGCEVRHENLLCV